MTKRKKLFWQIFPSYLLIVTLTPIAASLYALHSLTDLYFQQAKTDLEAKARLVGESLSQGSSEEAPSIVKNLSAGLGVRITVVSPDGTVQIDSHDDPKDMDNHRDRPEIHQALLGETGHAERYSHTLQQQMLYTAVPVYHGNQVTAVIRAALPMAGVSGKLNDIYRRMLLIGLSPALAVALLSYFFSRRFSYPIEELKLRAHRLAKGEVLPKFAFSNSEEIASLAQAMDEMAEQLAQQIRTESQQRNEKEAILSSMIEGVMALDPDEKVMSLNRAAADFFGVTPGEARGRPIQELVRNSELQNFIRESFASREGREREITLTGAPGDFSGNEERIFQLYGSALKDAEEKSMGVLIMLHEVTHMRRLESMRRDFVANVSHELKTPITSIKGFVETLLDGSYKEPTDAKRFLEIINRHADRLNAIIDDLLSLARIEQEETAAVIEREDSSIKEVLKGAILACEAKWKEKSIDVELDCPENLSAPVNPRLLEQAIVNLIDNAVKYSAAKKPVLIKASRQNGELLIRIKDEGVGMKAEDLPRIFERFYRVDKSRSRTLGGTGLGLAIVKHIAQVHQGRVEVESELGLGSVFTLFLPLS